MSQSVETAIDKFKVDETSPFFPIGPMGPTGSYGSVESGLFKNEYVLKFKDNETKSVIRTSGIVSNNSKVSVGPTGPLINPEITILRYNNNPLVNPFGGPSFVWSEATWTLDNTLPNYSWTANATRTYQQEEQNASSLISVTIGTSVTIIDGYSFNSCTNLTSITIPPTVNINTIGERAFNNCESLSSITIPSSVNWISTYAFAGCTSLSSITILGSVPMITNSAFFGCINLTSITIPESVTQIETNAFRNCYNLTSITIPSLVTSIQNGAFQSSGITIVYVRNNQLYDIPSPSLNVPFYGLTVETRLPPSL